MHKPSLKHYHLPTKSSLSTAATSSTSCTSSQLPLSIDTTSHAIHRECILFPTYAFRDPSSKPMLSMPPAMAPTNTVIESDRWIVRTKGWALSMKKPGPKQRVLKGKTSVQQQCDGLTVETCTLVQASQRALLEKGLALTSMPTKCLRIASNTLWPRESATRRSKSRPLERLPMQNGSILETIPLV